jgi:hypothetical protein
MVAAFNGVNHSTSEAPAFGHMHLFTTDEMADLREHILRQAILDEELSAPRASPCCFFPFLKLTL